MDNTDRLLALGIDSQTASELLASGWTAGKLRKATTSQLAGLNLPEEFRKAVHRPPIPTETFIRVLHRSKRVCCVCRDPRNPIIIHHIEEWHSTKDHSESNLAVLCLNHHAWAHSTGKLSQNLSPTAIRGHKKEWEKQVEQEDARTLLGLSTVDYANWDYVNLVRVFRLAEQLRLPIQEMRGYEPLRSAGLIVPTGDIANHVYRPANPGMSMYLRDLAEGRMLYVYIASIMMSCIAELGLVDISAVKNRAELAALAPDGTYVFIQAPFYFRWEQKPRQGQYRTGPGQTRIGYTTLAGVRTQFSFDAWETTSASAHGDRLSGRKVESVIGVVSSYGFDEKTPLQISCLAMGSNFRRIHFRQAGRFSRIFGQEEDSFQPDETIFETESLD